MSTSELSILSQHGKTTDGHKISGKLFTSQSL